MNERDAHTSHAVDLLVASALDQDRERLNRALRKAFSAARCSLEEDLSRTHLPAVEERHGELVQALESDESWPPLTFEAWLLVLSHLSPELQKLLQSIYEDLERGAEVALEYGERDQGEALTVIQRIAPAEALLVGLPYTTLAPSSGVDDYDIRRRTLSVEIERIELEAKDDHNAIVRWRDGYESVVATLMVSLVEDILRCTLEIDDPHPGRSAFLNLPCSRGEVGGAASKSLDDAIAWANSQLEQRYVIVQRSDPEQANEHPR